MGALSSWPVFSLSHHIVVQMAARAAYPKIGRWFAKYCMIGDDIAIFDRRVAERYVEILTRIDVPINLTKSVQPNPHKAGKD